MCSVYRDRYYLYSIANLALFAVANCHIHVKVFSIHVQFSSHALPNFETGKLRVPVDSTFSLEEASMAHDHMRKSKNIGKLLLTVKS